jgi:hypothetical protein
MSCGGVNVIKPFLRHMHSRAWSIRLLKVVPSQDSESVTVSLLHFSLIFEGEVCPSGPNLKSWTPTLVLKY